MPGFVGGAAGLMKAFGSDGGIGKTLGANSSIGSSLRGKPATDDTPIATLPSWAKAGQTPSWMPNFGQQQAPADGGFMDWMQRIFGPRR